jgi:hypothetical protein
MDLQHINVKLLVQDSVKVDLAPVIPIFHSWIQGQVFEERLLDVADYRHVHAGPGVVLIGLEGDYSVDNADGRLGVRYNRKAALLGSNSDRLTQAARAALSACQRLEEDATLGGNFRFNGRDVEVFINDRLLAPNREETRAAVDPEFNAFFTKLFGGAEYSLSSNGDPRRLFAVSVKAARQFSAAELLKNLSET